MAVVQFSTPGTRHCAIRRFRRQAHLHHHCHFCRLRWYILRLKISMRFACPATHITCTAEMRASTSAASKFCNLQVSKFAWPPARAQDFQAHKWPHTSGPGWVNMQPQSVPILLQSSRCRRHRDTAHPAKASPAKSHISRSSQICFILERCIYN